MTTTIVLLQIQYTLCCKLKTFVLGMYNFIKLSKIQDTTHINILQYPCQYPPIKIPLHKETNTSRLDSMTDNISPVFE